MVVPYEAELVWAPPQNLGPWPGCSFLGMLRPARPLSSVHTSRIVFWPPDGVRRPNGHIQGLGCNCPGLSRGLLEQSGPLKFYCMLLHFAASWIPRMTPQAGAGATWHGHCASYFIVFHWCLAPRLRKEVLEQSGAFNFCCI